MDHLRNCWRSKLVKKFLQIQLLPCNMGAQIETRKQQPICTFCVPISVMRIAYSSRPLLLLDDHAAQPNTENLSSGLQSNTENLNIRSATQHWKSEFTYSTRHWKLVELRFETQHWKSELRFENQTLEIWGQALKPNTGNYVSFLSNTSTRWWTLMMKKQWEFIAAMIIKPQASSSSSSSSNTRLINLLATT